MSDSHCTVSLKSLATITMGQSPDSSCVNTSERGLPFLQGCAEFGAYHPSAKVFCSPPLRTACAGSTLISVRAPVGTMNRADQDYCIGRGLGAFLAIPGVADDMFLKHAVEQNISYLDRRSQGSTFLAISANDLQTIPLPEFDLPNQQRIAEILSTVDEAIEQTEALIAKTRQIKAGLMHDLFTRGVTPDGQLRPTREEAPQFYKESPLGWIPKEWDVKIAGDLAKSIVPGRDKPDLDGGRYPWITITDLTGSQVSQSNAKLSLSSASVRKAGSRVLPSNTVVMSCVGEFGIASVASCELVINQQLHGFVAGESVRPDWLMLVLRRSKSFVERIATQTTIKYLNKASCESIPIPLSCLDEQDQIVRRVFAVEEAASVEGEKLKTLIHIKAGLMADLLSGRVGVPIAPIDCGQEAVVNG